jgi:hypothetical protein
MAHSFMSLKLSMSRIMGYLALLALLPRTLRWVSVMCGGARSLASPQSRTRASSRVACSGSSGDVWYVFNASIPVAPTGWDDVGNFSSIAELLPAEANQPRILGDGGLGTSTAVLFQDLTCAHRSYRAGRRWDRCTWLWPAGCVLWRGRHRDCRYALRTAGYDACPFTGSEKARQESQGFVELNPTYSSCLSSFHSG